MKESIILFTTIFFVLLTGAYLLEANGYQLSKKDTKEEQFYIPEQEQEDLSEWQVMKLAIVKIESEFNTLAIGEDNASGIFQICPIYVKEVNRIIGEEKYLPEEAFNTTAANDMFESYQAYYNPEHDIDRAITLHNPTASSAYAAKVKKNMQWIRNYEEIKRRLQ